MIFSEKSWGKNYHLSLVWAPTYNLAWPQVNSGGLSLVGGGGSFELYTSAGLGLEVGLFYQTYLLNSFVSDHIILPLGIRFWPGKHFTFNLGFFGGYQLTNIPPQINPFDFGFRGAAGVNLLLSKKLGYLIELGGQYSLINLSLESGSFHQHQVFFLTGFRLEI